MNCGAPDPLSRSIAGVLQSCCDAGHCGDTTISTGAWCRCDRQRDGPRKNCIHDRAARTRGVAPALDGSDARHSLPRGLNEERHRGGDVSAGSARNIAHCSGDFEVKMTAKLATCANSKKWLANCFRGMSERSIARLLTISSARPRPGSASKRSEPRSGK